MEMFIWLGVCIVLAVVVFMAAPHHHRLIDKRPRVGDPSNWD